MSSRRERDRARAEDKAAADPEWQRTSRDIEGRGGSLKLPATWSKRDLHVRTHEAVAKATRVLHEAATAPTLDLTEWERWQMADNLAALQQQLAAVQHRLGRPTGLQVAVTNNGQHGHAHSCAFCGRAFTARKDAAYCSNACRQRAYRQRGGAQ